MNGHNVSETTSDKASEMMPTVSTELPSQQAIHCSSVTDLRSHFYSPDLLYAPHAFWFWNSPEELNKPEYFAWMAEEMSKQGLNPGYVQARYYREGEDFWLTEDWLTCFKAALERSEQAGTSMSYTMGDPSFPDKYILPDHPELMAESLGWTINEIDGCKPLDVPASFFSVAAELNGNGRLLSSTLTIIGDGAAFRWTAPEGNVWRVYSFTKYHDYHHDGGKPINFLDHRITAPWLKVENAKYAGTTVGHFGKTMKAVFFDLEGSFGYKIAWSKDLDDDYREQKHVDIRLHMPLLIEEDAEGLWAKARWDWFDVLSRLYIDCLLTPLDRWCRERGMMMTCHFWEEKLFKQAICVGNFMGAQRSYSIPGTDALFRTIHNPRYFKETQSVCEFEDRPLMCEGYGVAGWHLSPKEIKAGANAAIANGVTHLIVHGVDSSPFLENVTYPPDFFHWNPYWRYFHLWAEFVRRASYINRQGQLDATVLLLCPMDSVWALIGDDYFDPDKPHHQHIDDASDVEFSHAAEVENIENVYAQAMTDLSSSRVDYLVADSHYVKKSTIGNHNALLCGSFSFNTIILPPLTLLPLDVARRITAFAKAGGYVYSLGSLPYASAEKGVGDPEMQTLMQELVEAETFYRVENGLEELIKANAPGLRSCVTFESGAFPLIATKRRIHKQDFFWLVNNEDTRQEFVLRIPNASGRVSLWNCENGLCNDIYSEVLPEGDSCVPLGLNPYEAIWLVVDPDKPPQIKPTAITFNDGILRLLNRQWTVSINVDDQPRLAQHKLNAPKCLLNGGEKRSLRSWLEWGLQGFSGFVDYQQDLDLDRVRGDEILDLGEVKHLAEVWINGVNVGARLWPPFRFEVGHLLKKGRNLIHVKIGNLILNAVTQYDRYDWNWYQPPTEEQLDSGLLGPVMLVGAM